MIPRNIVPGIPKLLDDGSVGYVDVGTTQSQSCGNTQTDPGCTLPLTC
jgi:hypothetical protein